MTIDVMREALDELVSHGCLNAAATLGARIAVQQDPVLDVNATAVGLTAVGDLLGVEVGL